jgi:hypothetical protein
MSFSVNFFMLISSLHDCRPFPARVPIAGRRNGRNALTAIRDAMATPAVGAAPA